ncbi:hypothetical protein CBR_g25811 [Chara braunii]|uniref:Uncharacterized protein n=1 Tax=Chara braunii TaxID=69332 RepID=A0A388L6F1_CHABU|nr:hypothetical protein CBR_g25811 [Chara braunii]|eukprot:GBG77879.1 hypothetical protein CBR_g25811 [Chara braunii]
MNPKRRIRRPTCRSCAGIRRQAADVVDDVVKTKTPHDVDIGRWYSPVSESASGHTNNTVCTMPMLRWCDDNVWRLALAAVFGSIGRRGKSASGSAPEKRSYGRSKLYHDRPWALDWVGGLHTPGCGAVVFLSDDNGLSWYCCGGVEKSEVGRYTHDGRKFMTFFLTSVYDKEGKNWVKEDKKVSLNHRLFQGYGVKALSMKAFDVRGNGTEFQMLDSEKFLSKTNGYRSAAGPKRRQDQPARAGGKRKQLATAPSSSAAVVQALPAPVPPSDRQGRDAAEQSSEATEYDDGAVCYRAGPQHRSREGVDAFDDEECDGQDGEGGGWDGEGGGEEGEGGGEEEEGGGEGDDGNEGDGEGEDDGMDEERDDDGEEVEDNRSSQFHRRHQNESRGRSEDNACRVGDEVDAGGQPAASRGMSQSYDQTKDERDEPGSRGKRKRGEASTSPASQTKQARADVVNEARGALTASQEARAPRKIGGGGRSGSRGGGRGGVRKGSVIESSISTDPGVWDRPELVLAPVDPTVIIGGKGRRITPDEFFQRGSAEFEWYAVCGQHTAEAMKRLVAKDSSAVNIYGLRTYSKVRVVFFDDDHTRGYFNVSLFDNTRENRAMMLSFQNVVRDMRQWWIDNNKIETPKAKVIEKDAITVAHQKTWQNFLRACMGKACDKAFVKQALDNEYNKDWSDKLRGYLNLATSTRTVWPLVEKFFAMFEEGKLPIGDGKIPLEMPGRMEGRLPDPYTDENKGQRTLYNCIYARDGPKGSTVSWKDLCPTYFKNFGDMTCREREVALLLLMSGKVVATKKRVTPPRVNTECLLDIMRKERYMVRMFNYVVFRANGRAGDEWNDDFFMLYKDLEERYASNGLCADEWEKQQEKLHSNLVKMIPRRLGGVEEARQGAGFGPTKVRYKEAPFHFKLLIYTAIDKLDMLRAEVKRIASSARHLVWDKLSRQTALLPVCMGSKEVMAAPVDIVAAAQKMACRAAIVDISAMNFSSAWTSQDFDALYAMMAKCCGPNWVLFFFAPHNVQSDVLRQLYRLEDIELIPGSWKRMDRPPSDVASSFVGEVEGVLLLGRAHAGLVWKFLLAGNNVIGCNELAKDIAYLIKFVDILVKDGRFECHIEKPHATHRTNRDMYHKLGPKRLKVWEYLFRDAPDGRLDGGYIYWKAKVTETLKHYHGALTGAFETFVARCELLRFDLHKDKLTFKDYADLAKSGEGFNPVDREEDSSDFNLEIEKDTNATGWCGKSAAMEHSFKGYGPGQSEGCSNLPPANSVASGVNRVVCTPVEDNEDDDLDIPAQPTKFAPDDPIPLRFCADPNNVYFLDDKYACTSEDKWGHDIIWHDDISSHVERAAALESMDVDSREDVAPVPETATGNTMGEQREDGGTMLGVKPPLPDAGNTPSGKNTIGAISVATGDTSQGEKVSLDKPVDAGATYGSLLATGAALAGTSEMVSESTAGMGVTGMSLHPPTCTSKGDAHCTTTPQGGVTGDDGNGGNAWGSPRSRNMEDMTTNDEDGVEGGKGVSDSTHCRKMLRRSSGN